MFSDSVLFRYALFARDVSLGAMVATTLPRQFRREHGHCRVPHGYASNRKLSWWVMNQRAQYAHRAQGQKTWLSEDRIQMLTDIGFIWTPHSKKKAGSKKGGSKAKKAGGKKKASNQSKSEKTDEEMTQSSDGVFFAF